MYKGVHMLERWRLYLQHFGQLLRPSDTQMYRNGCRSFHQQQQPMSCQRRSGIRWDTLLELKM